MAISKSNDKLFPRDEDGGKVVYHWILASKWRLLAGLAKRVFWGAGAMAEMLLVVWEVLRRLDNQMR